MDNTFISGEYAFEFGIIPPTECVPIQIMLAKTVFAPLLKASKENKDGTKMDIGSLVEALSANLDADAVVATMQTAFKYTRCNGNRVLMESFNGKPLLMWQVLAHSLAFNLKDFFPAGLSISDLGKTPA